MEWNLCHQQTNLGAAHKVCMVEQYYGWYLQQMVEVKLFMET